jgi:hypothetical protein
LVVARVRVPDNPTVEVDARNRARRHAAYARAAETHRRAAEREQQAAVQFDLAVMQRRRSATALRPGARSSEQHGTPREPPSGRSSRLLTAID